MVSRFRNPLLIRFLIALVVISWDCFGQECWLNNPFASFVKLELSLERERLLLKLRNDSQKQVKLIGITLLVEGSESPVHLLQEPVDLPPADRHYLELGSTLIRFFDEKTGRQEKVVRFQLILNPEPADQPKECGFKVMVEGQQFTKSTRVPVASNP